MVARGAARMLLIRVRRAATVREMVYFIVGKARVARRKEVRMLEG